MASRESSQAITGATPSALPYTKPEHFGICVLPGGGAISTDAVGPDNEGRWPIEAIGFYRFAWMPRRCRNGKVRWLCWVEDHGDGTFTLGNRCG